MKKRYSILIPVFNDWLVLDKLLLEISSINTNGNISKVYIVDDCSSQEHQNHLTEYNIPIEIIHLNRNVGHQKAIAIGLSYLNNLEEKLDGVIVMDSDGEDKPEDIVALIEKAENNPQEIIFAQRAKRNEGLVFGLFYKLYKIIFKLFTGKFIGFGNFSLIPLKHFNQLANNPDIWNHFSGAVIKSRIPYCPIPLDRGKRLAGKSKMGFTSLVNHGLSAIAVHLETVIARILLLSIVMILFCVAGLVIIFILRFFTNMAIPGWATNAFIGLLIIIFQSFLTSLLLLFILLFNRTQLKVIPNEHYVKLISKNTLIEK